MWRRLASSPYITEEERREFMARAAVVVDTSSEFRQRLNEAIRRERDSRRRGEQIVTALPPGLCVSHSVNATAYVAQAEQLTSSGTYSVTPAGAARATQRLADNTRPTLNTAPGFQYRDVSWDRRLTPPAAKGANVVELAKLIGALFSGGVTNISYSQSAESPRAKLSVEISIPADISYDDVIANLQQLSREHSNAKPTHNTGRRRLLKLEEGAA